MVYQVTRRWSGRWRETFFDLPAGSLVIEQGTPLGGIDLGGCRTFTLEAEACLWINRDSPGVLVEYEPPKPAPAPKARQETEPPNDRQVKAAVKTRRRRKKKEGDA